MAENGSDLLYNICCYVCKEDNVNKEAMFYCQQCSKGYCGGCIEKHKGLFKKHTPFGRKEMNKWPVAETTLDALQHCQQHPDHRIELFCEDHKKLCCLLCHLYDHKQCNTVVYIAEKAKKMHEAGDFQRLAATIEKEQQKLEKEIDMANDCLQKLQASYDRAHEEINLFRKKINDILDTLERNTVQSLDILLDTLKKALQSDIGKCSKLKEDFKNIQEGMTNVNDQRNVQTFIAYTKSIDMISNTQTMLKETSASRTVDITFHVNPGIEQCLSVLSDLGNVVYSSSRSETRISGELLKCKEKMLYNVKLESDMKTCDIYGICELPSGELLIVDSSNDRLKLLDKQYTVVAHTDLSDTPCDMCSVSPTEVAVASYTGCTVQFLSANNRQIVKGRKLKFEHFCNGIAHYKGNLYITSRTALYQYTLDGQLVKKMYKDTTDTCTVYKCAVSLDGKRLYVTNLSHSKLLTLYMGGILLSSLVDPALRGPTGVDVSETRQLLVCGSHNVVQVDGEGGVVTLASKEDGLYWPESVYYSARTGRLIVGQHHDNILVINTG